MKKLKCNSTFCLKVLRLTYLLDLMYLMYLQAALCDHSVEMKKEQNRIIVYHSFSQNIWNNNNLSLISQFFSKKLRFLYH